MLRLERQDLPESGRGFIRLSLEQERAAQVIVGVIRFGPDGDDGAAAPFHLHGLPQLRVDLRQADPRFDVLIVLLAYLFEGRFGLVQTAIPEKR
jgi:hypothetical protein